jgi:cytochrome c-type biogenesis protein
VTGEIILAAGSALWLGILTSVSPCPLATNIAAVSYIGKRVDRQRLVLLSGTLYTLGRTLGYFAIAFIAIRSMISLPVVSLFLQRHMNQFLGPILVIAGILVMDVIPIPWLRGNELAARLQGKIDKLGMLGAFLLGLVFALSFCPVSAALFFGSLIPLATQYQSSVLMPVAYGFGTALPVVVFSILLAFAAHRVSTAFNVLTRVEPWMRRFTGIIFIVVGGYYCLMYLFNVL